MDLNKQQAAAAAEHAGLSFPPGARVIDGVTGTLGTVRIGQVTLEQARAGQVAIRATSASSAIANGLRPIETYLITLDDGETVSRRRDQLISTAALFNVDIEEL